MEICRKDQFIVFARLGREKIWLLIVSKVSGLQLCC